MPKTFHHNRDPEALEREIAEREVVKLPDAAAMVLGESTPGWRREAERSGEIAARRRRKTSRYGIQHTILANRLGARINPERNPGSARPKRPKRLTLRTYREGNVNLVIRYFDKFCVVRLSGARALDLERWLINRYGHVGLRTEITKSRHLYTEFSWAGTIKPLVERALARRSQERKDT